MNFSSVAKYRDSVKNPQQQFQFARKEHLCRVRSIFRKKHNDKENLPASSIEWVVRIIALFFFMDAIKFHIFRLIIGSIPVEGSSKNTIFGSPMKAIATANFLLFPPLSCFEVLLR